MNIYLDIDGVLLHQKKMTIPEGAEELIRYCLTNHKVFWLTTHCRNNENKAIQYLKSYYSPSLIELLKRVEPTTWDTLKTEAIDFAEPFAWLDDSPFNAEIEILKKRNRQESLIKVDLNNTNELKGIISKLNLLSWN